MEQKAFVVELNDRREYQRLFQSPQTMGMKAGRVWLDPGAECGSHSTGDREECLVFLAGEGIARIGQKELHIGAGKVCYIPPNTEHNIINTGSEPLVYIFCVAPAAEGR